jgi:hypothetical protein
VLRKIFELEEEEVAGKREKGKKYAVGFAVCSRLIIHCDKSRKLEQTEHEGNPKERNSCRGIATEETMFIFCICLLVSYLLRLPVYKNMNRGEWKVY